MGVTVHGTMDRYVRVPWEFLANPENPTNERGLFATLLGLPPDWNFSIRGLTKILPEGKSSINRMLSNLQRKGYVKLIQKRNPNGHFGQTDLIIELTPANTLSVPQRQTISRAQVKHDNENRDPDTQDPGIWCPAFWNPAFWDSTEQPESNNKESIMKESYITPKYRVGNSNTEKTEETPEKGSGRKNFVSANSSLYIGAPRQVPGRNRFNNFKQRQYDFDVLEQQLLQAQQHQKNEN